MSLNQRLFIIVPLVSALCNIFLLLTVLSARKNRQIYAFMELLGAFTAWCTGSLFMRMTVYPGPSFWYEVSIMGIFLSPFFVYNFLYCFTESKGRFVWGVLFSSWIVTTFLNLFHVFITSPQVIETNGERRFEYGVSPLIIIPILLVVVTLFEAGRLAYQSVKEDRVPLAQFRPLIFGVMVMFLCTASAVLPQMVSLPVDTFSCGVNAVCLYYALYKKRIIRLQGIASNGPAYLISAVLTTLLLVAGYRPLERFYEENFPAYHQYEVIIFAVGFSVVTMVVYTVVHRLMNNLFSRAQEQQEAQLKEFSDAINKTLDLERILEIYRESLQRNFPGRIARVFLYQKPDQGYRVFDCTVATLAKHDFIPEDNPLVVWLKSYNHGISYDEFRRTRIYRSLWDEEKRRFEEMGASFILPVVCDGELTAITIFSNDASEGKQQELNFREITFLESMSSVLSMALRNASLYAALENKARRDPLTNLFNRGYFEECIHRDFELCRHDSLSLLMISFDDFRLYNELYGTAEGDRILRRFGEQLTALIGSRGTVARYGGKEFAVSLPFCTATTAESFAQQARQWLKLEVGSTSERTRTFLTFSAGICAYPVSAASVEELFTYANMALYAAKSGGKNRIVLYNPRQSAMETEHSYQQKRDLAQNCAPTIYALTAAIDAKDHYTFNHSLHVAEYASILAAAIPLDAEHVEIIRQAGMLHDIGKIGIPEAILSKTTRLTREEYSVMKQHVEGSIAMIRYLPSLDYVIPSAIGHHERWDGHGYPRGIAGEAIPIGARCLCLADSFDAMISKRSYKDAMSVEEALEEIERNLGTQFDPELGRLFIRLVREGKIRPHQEEVELPSEKKGRTRTKKSASAAARPQQISQPDGREPQRKKKELPASPAET